MGLGVTLAEDEWSVVNCGSGVCILISPLQPGPELPLDDEALKPGLEQPPHLRPLPGSMSRTVFLPCPPETMPEAVGEVVYRFLGMLCVDESMIGERHKRLLNIEYLVGGAEELEAHKKREKEATDSTTNSALLRKKDKGILRCIVSEESCLDDLAKDPFLKRILRVSSVLMLLLAETGSQATPPTEALLTNAENVMKIVRSCAKPKNEVSK